MKQPEGATTQPTPAAETMGPLNARDQSAVNAGCNCSRKMPYYDWTHDPSCALFASIKSYPSKVAQPVPSAGSKPQEEGGTLEDALIEAIAALRSSYNVQDFPADGDTRQDHAANALEAILHRRLTPVADGGGLPPLLVAKKMWPDSEIQQQLAVDMWKDSPETTFAGAAFSVIASSQETLRESERQKNLAIVAASCLRERMQQAVEVLKRTPHVYANKSVCLNDANEAISLLSPDGSSRS